MSYHKCYSTKESKYSTVGRKNISISNNAKCSDLMPPKYGQAFKSHKSKEKLQQLLN